MKDWPSTTTVLDKFGLYVNLDQFALEHPEIIADTHRNPMHRGKRVHDACHILGADKELEDDWIERHPECEGWITVRGERVPRLYISAYRKFKKQHKFTLIAAERELLHPLERFVSHPDQLGILDGWASNVEIKTGDTFPKGVDLQTAGQNIAADHDKELLSKLYYRAEFHGPTRRYGLLLKPNGDYELREFKDPRDYSEFRLLLRAYWVAEAKLR